jgi:hypothetical protein
MKTLYVDGSVFWERFKDPLGYLTFRRQVEENLREGFIQKGGRPQDDYPIYLMLGRLKWTIDVGDAVSIATTEEIKVPLELLADDQVSFTYPDSMVSAFILGEKNLAYFEPEYQGKVFRLYEIEAIVEKKGLPGEGWETTMPRHLAHYIEAQVWNHDLLRNFYEASRAERKVDFFEATAPQKYSRKGFQKKRLDRE